MNRSLRKSLGRLAGILCLAGCYCLPLTAQDADISYTFRHLDIQDGLASNHVSAILQDRKGFIWIASTALQRYDGSNLVTVASFDRVPGSIYYDDICLCEDRKGRIWMGAPDNIRVYDPATGLVKAVKMDIQASGKDHLGCSGLLQDHAGVIWATTQEGLLYYNEARGCFVKAGMVPEHLREQMYSGIAEDSRGNLWLSGDKGVCILDKQRRQLYNARHNPHNNPMLRVNTSVKKMFIDHLERVWIAARADGKLYCYHPDSNRVEEFQFPLKPASGGPLVQNVVFDVKEDAARSIWVATELGGIYRFDEARRRFTTNITASNNDDLGLHYSFEVNCFLNDRDGRLWVGTDRGVNILSLHNRSFRMMDHRTTFRHTGEKLPREEVTGLFQANNGDVYTGYWGRGFSRLSAAMELKGNFLHRGGDPAYSLPEDRSQVWSFAGLPNGQVLVGQENGWLSVFDPGRNRFEAHYQPPIFGRQTLMRMLVESDTSVWIGLYKKGLARWNPQRKEFYHYPELNAYFRRPVTVMDIVPRQDSLLWLATSSEGLLRFNRNTRKITGAVFFRYEHLVVNNITSLHFFNDTTLVAGTDHGLWVYNTRSGFAQPLKINGTLFDEWVLSILPHGPDGLWFTTQYGFYQFNRRYFTLETFVQSNDIIDNNRKVRRRIVRLRDGRLMVGASDHFVVFDPARLKVAPPPPDVTIIGMKAMDDNVNIEAAQEARQPVTLSYRQNFIGIEFKSLQYHHEKIRYLYQLEGVDAGWVNAEGLLVARYTNLPPGSYTFKVRSVNTAGTFSANITRLLFNIKPAFWQTTWFRMLCLLLAAAFVYLYFRLRIHYIKKEARRRTAIQQQMAQLEMKALRAQMNPHFIFNALNSIQTFMMKSETEQALAYLGRFARLIRNVLDSSQLNSIPVSREVQMLENYLELEKLRFSDQFEYSIYVDPALEADLTDIPTMILQPFVENAIWHGLLHKKERGRVVISFRKMNDLLLCTVEDNGIGRESSAAMRQQSGTPHHSRGLQITRDRLALYNSRFNLDATFTIEDLKNEAGQPAGTRVNVWFPLVEE